jgi:hypothetical protein
MYEVVYCISDEVPALRIEKAKTGKGKNIVKHCKRRDLEMQLDFRRKMEKFDSNLGSISKSRTMYALNPN